MTFSNVLRFFFFRDGSRQKKTGRPGGKTFSRSLNLIPADETNSREKSAFQGAKPATPYRELETMLFFHYHGFLQKRRGLNDRPRALILPRARVILGKDDCLTYG